VKLGQNINRRTFLTQAGLLTAGAFLPKSSLSTRLASASCFYTEPAQLGVPTNGFGSQEPTGR
jgi:hypothetical protein